MILWRWLRRGSWCNFLGVCGKRADSIITFWRKIGIFLLSLRILYISGDRLGDDFEGENRVER